MNYAVGDEIFVEEEWFLMRIISSNYDMVLIEVRKHISTTMGIYTGYVYYNNSTIYSIFKCSYWQQ